MYKQGRIIRKNHCLVTLSLSLSLILSCIRDQKVNKLTSYNYNANF